MQPVTARLIPFARLNGFENMATDEYLISWHERHRRPVLRIYGWGPPAISLGRYQRIECLKHDTCRTDVVDIVRRITGGGAIYHHNEVTYSFICDAGSVGESLHSVKESFSSINRFIIEMYRMMGLAAVYAKTAPGQRVTGHRADFCYSGNEEYDIIIHGIKIGGNAQRRKGNIIFQHGSIPLQIDTDRICAYFNTSIDTQNFTCLDDISGRSNTTADVADALLQAFKKTTGWRLEEEEIGAAEQEEIDAIMNEKYLRASWNNEGKADEYEFSQAGMAQ
jgi:lipoyl(octanoyl) transferase